MFRAPDVYQAGMAVAPVAERAQLRHDLPGALRRSAEHRFEAAYSRRVAVYFARGLRGDLLVVHGSGDDNVHYQGTEQLINALVAANKPFTMMEYPNRTHGIYEGPGTRVHLFNLLTRFLNEHVAAGGR